MTAQWILVSVLGSLSGHQILRQLSSLRVISSRTLARMKIILTPACAFLMFLMREKPIESLVVVLSLHFLPLALMIWNQKARAARFQRQILPFLDELLLKMRSGKSLRESLDGLSAANSGDFSEISSRIRFPERKNQLALIAEAQELLVEMRKMDQSSARVIEKLRAYRKKLKMAQKFRQKSSQVTGQVKAQAIVCSFLYVALLFWTLLSAEVSILSAPILLSFIFFLVGLTAMFAIGRSFRWKL